MRALPLSVFALVLLASPASARRPPRDLEWGLPRDKVLRYAFETEHQVETRLVTAPPGMASPAEVEALGTALSRWTFVLRGELDRQLARVFRDGTWGQLVRLSRAEGAQVTPGGPVPIESEALVGKSVVLRSWPSGETFELSGFEQLAGAGRMVELWSHVFTQLSIRLPRRLPGDGTAIAEEASNVSLKVPLSGLATLEQGWSIRWLRSSEVDCDGGRCHELDYAATITETGAGSRPDRRTEVSGKGRVDGTVRLDTRTRELVSHDYRIESARTLTTRELPPAPKQDGPQRAVVELRDRSETRIRRLP